jgi:hypothetical protein
VAEREKPAIFRVQEVDARGTPTAKKAVRADELRTDGPRTPLAPELRAVADKLYKRCGQQMLGQTRDQWYAGFERDRHPGKELAIWCLIATVADRLWEHPASKMYRREQVDKSVVLAVSDFVDVPARTGVSDEFVRLILEMYKDEKQRMVGE